MASQNQLRMRNPMRRRSLRKSLPKRKKTHSLPKRNSPHPRNSLSRPTRKQQSLRNKNKSSPKRLRNRTRRKISFQDKSIRLQMKKTVLWHSISLYSRKTRNHKWASGIAWSTEFQSLRRQQECQRKFPKPRNDLFKELVRNLNNQINQNIRPYIFGWAMIVIDLVTKFINESMTTRRLKTETIDPDVQKSVRSIERQHFFQQNRKKYKLSSGNLHSLHSIDTKRSSINLYHNARIKCPQRRRQLSIPINQPKHILTQRPQIYEINSKKPNENRCLFPIRQQRMHTIEDERLENKQKRIKNCIEVMCGVLQEIRNQKSSNKVPKQKIIEQFVNCQETTKNKEEPESKFQNYIKNITKLKEGNKVILIKRGKSKSIINNENISSSNVNSKSFLLKQKPAPLIQTIQPPILKRNFQPPTSRPKKTVSKVKLQEISCSSIEKANQSSFVSEFSRQSFVKNILEEPSCKPFVEDRQMESKKVVKIKNSKQLKQLFPADFF